jgi:AraC-like DNA-binding protein
MQSPALDANSESRPLFVESRKLQDMGELEEAVRGWDLDFRHLGPPSYASRLFQALSPDVLLSYVRLGMPVLQEGGTPPGMRTFGILDPGVRVSWARREVGAASLMSFGPGGSCESRTDSNFGAISVSVREEALARTSASLGLPEITDLIEAGPQVLECHPGSLGALREALVRIIEFVERDLRPAQLRATQRELDAEVTSRILEMVAEGRPVAERSTSAERSRILARSLEYLHDHPRQALTVGALCDAVRCNERTLRRAYLERFAVPPRRYLKLMRLNGVQRELRSADPDEALVADVANHWGFWHMGDFAADYRRLFGELPSETLARRDRSTPS